MNINQIIVLKETKRDEGRVALTPHAVSLLTIKNLPILVEKQAGRLAGFSDDEYLQAGAQIFELNSKLPSHSFILRVKCPTNEREILENKLFSSNTIMMGFLDPLDDDISHIARWKLLGLKLISLELLPLTANDPKNAQAAMSRFAGRLALQDALVNYQGSSPIKVTIFGTGPAGMEAAFAARELQLPVQLFGRQEQFRQKIESAGITYYVLPQSNPLGYIHNHLSDQTIVITAARSIGKKAPLLIDEQVLAILPKYSILIDLSTGEGSSIVGSKSDQKITIDRNISIINVSGYPKAEPQAASMAFATCMVNLLLDIMTNDGKINLENPLLKQ